MIMRKRTPFLRRKPFSLSLIGEKLLWGGLSVILMPLLRLLYEIRLAAPFSVATANRFGGYLEYIVAALTLLTLGVYLVERVIAEERGKK